MVFSRNLEIETVRKMIEMYCQSQHSGNKYHLCDECQSLMEYAAERIKQCPYQDSKPVCSTCQVHCYKASMRERIREAMRYAGPRMIFQSPLLAIRYLYRKRFKSNLHQSLRK